MPSDNHTMKSEQTEQVMMNELQVIIRKKVQDMMAMKEKRLNETIKSLEESVISKTGLLEEVIEAKTILETTVVHLKRMDEIKTSKITDLIFELSQSDRSVAIVDDEFEDEMPRKRRRPEIQTTIRRKDKLIKLQQSRISSLKKQNKKLKSELSVAREIGAKSKHQFKLNTDASAAVQVTALKKQIQMMKKAMDIFANGNNADEYELLLKEKDLQIAEYIKGLDMNKNVIKPLCFDAQTE